MQHIVWALHITLLSFCVRADLREPLRFQCPREYEREVGCIYRGNFIDEARCLELCQGYFRALGQDVGAQAVCENNEECECRIIPGLGVGEAFGVIMSLTELEEDRALANRPSERHYATDNVRCGYLDELITVEECLQKCTVLQNRRGVTLDPSVHCEMSLRCKCQDADDDGYSYYVDLDLLEAQCDIELEYDRAASVRHWLETHNGVGGLWSGIATPMRMLK